MGKRGNRREGRRDRRPIDGLTASMTKKSQTKKQKRIVDLPPTRHDAFDSILWNASHRSHEVPSFTEFLFIDCCVCHEKRFGISHGLGKKKNSVNNTVKTGAPHGPIVDVGISSFFFFFFGLRSSFSTDKLWNIVEHPAWIPRFFRFVPDLSVFFSF